MSGVGYNPLENLVGGGIDDIRLTDPVTGAGLFTPNTDPTVVGIDPLTGLDAPMGTDVLFGSMVRRLFTAGLYNADFSVPPPDPAMPINSDPSSADYNPLPCWRLVDGSNGRVTVWWEADPDAPGGGQIRFDLTPPDDVVEVYLEQFADALGSPSRIYATSPLSTWTSVGGSFSESVFSRTQYVRSDSVTPTGTPHQYILGLNGLTPVSPWTLQYDVSGPSLTAPADAGRVRVEVGIRQESVSAYSGSVILHEAALVRGTVQSLIVDDTAPDNPPGLLYKRDAITYLAGYGNPDSTGYVAVESVISGAAANRVRLGGSLVFDYGSWVSLGSNPNDYSPTSWQHTSNIYIDGGGSNRTISGFAAPTGGAPGGVGTTRLIWNFGTTNNIILSHNDMGSSPSNRVVLPNNANLTIRPRGGVLLQWYGDSGHSNLRWRALEL
ncbi:MAG: hypothetical protein KF809_17300 [Chloroflexi bacterium]|nr:hypothetical protein [Chloroflexota bacterium]